MGPIIERRRQTIVALPEAAMLQVPLGGRYVINFRSSHGFESYQRKAILQWKIHLRQLLLIIESKSKNVTNQM